jgi:hypothetical protein
MEIYIATIGGPSFNLSKKHNPKCGGRVAGNCVASEENKFL